MSASLSPRFSAALLLLALLTCGTLSACAGGDAATAPATADQNTDPTPNDTDPPAGDGNGNGNGNGNQDDPSTTTVDDPEPDPPPAPGDSPPPAKSCREQFDPELAVTGADCAPTYGQFCPESTGGLSNSEIPTACDGVRIDHATASAGNLSAGYWIATPESGEIRSTYLALHWAGANGASMIDRMRLAELAKGRGARVIAPDAPGTLGTWDVTDLNLLAPRTVDEHVALLDAILADVGVRDEPLIVAGISGGAAFAFQYACDRAEWISGLLIVAADLQDEDLRDCALGGHMATLQIHGTGDYITPYDPVTFVSAGVENVFARLMQNNGCAAAERRSVVLPNPTDTLITELELVWYATGCQSDAGSARLKLGNGGHNWPGYSGTLSDSQNIFGVTSRDFDATLQAYDLLLKLMPSS